MAGEWVVIADNGAAAGSGGGMLGLLGPFLIFGVMIFFIFRAQRKETKRREEMISSIKSGDKVLAGGIYGIVAQVKDKSFIVKIAEGVKIEVSKAGVTLVPPDDTAAPAKTAEDAKENK
jgi:preprotein translocase subunit YajC